MAGIKLVKMHHSAVVEKLLSNDLELSDTEITNTTKFVHNVKKFIEENNFTKISDFHFSEFMQCKPDTSQKICVSDFLMDRFQMGSHGFKSV